MKYLILIILLINNIAYSQTYGIDSISNKLTYKYVVDVDSMNAKDILKTAKSALAKTYKSYKTVSQVETDDEIILKGYFETYIRKGQVSGGVEYTLAIKIKDNKYKITITDLSHTCKYHTGQSFNAWTGKYMSLPCGTGGDLEKNEAKMGFFANKKRWDEIKYNSEIYCKELGLAFVKEFNLTKINSDNW